MGGIGNGLRNGGDEVYQDESTSNGTREFVTMGMILFRSEEAFFDYVIHL